MLKIGEFSKLSMLTIKTLRFYEEEALMKQQSEIAKNLSVIRHLLEGNGKKYQVTEKTIPACIVYYSEDEWLTEIQLPVE